MKEKMKTRSVSGVITAIITPIDEHGNVENTLLEKQVSYLCSSGIQGLFVCGTTGEGAYLSQDKKIQVLRIVKEVANSNIAICAACIQPSTRMVIEEIRMIESIEPDFIVAVTPYYYDVSQREIVEHYREIARHSPFPVIIYNIPQRTHNPIDLKTIIEISEIEKISGIKDSSGDFVAFSRGIIECGKRSFLWIQGEDYLDGLSLLFGAHGIVTGLGNVWIEPYVELYQKAKEKDIRGVKELQKKINTLYDIIKGKDVHSTAAIKMACTILGRCTPSMVQGYMNLEDSKVDRIKKILTSLDLLKQ